MHPPTDIRYDRLFAAQCGVDIVTFSQRMPQGLPCHYCGQEADTRDHIVPDSQGGAKAWWNLVAACAGCNQGRGNDGVVLCSCRWCARAVAFFMDGNRRSGQSQQDRPAKRRSSRRKRGGRK